MKKIYLICHCHTSILNFHMLACPWYEIPPMGWILLNVGMMPKILRYLIKVSTLLSNVRFWALFRRLEECTHWKDLYTFNPDK